MQTEHAVDFLARALAMPALDKPPTPIETHCLVTGSPITEGYAVRSVVPDSAGNRMELLRGFSDGYLCDAAARCFKNTWNLGSRFILEDGTHYHPLINREEAVKQERICWSDLLRTVYHERQGQRYVGILTTDFKKRLWPWSRIATVGKQGLLYVYDSDRGIAGNIRFDWATLITVLDTIENAYLHFTKPKIEQNLLLDLEAASVYGWPQTVALEAALRTLRGTSEFSIAIVIAQKSGLPAAPTQKGLFDVAR